MQSVSLMKMASIVPGVTLQEAEQHSHPSSHLFLSEFGPKMASTVSHSEQHWESGIQVVS
jgi:hypothetical protein